jgi:hypothetical protein
MSTAAEFGKMIAERTKAVLEKALGAVNEKIDSLERAIEVNRLSIASIGKMIEELPVPKDGKDAMPITDGQIDERLSEYLTVHPIQIPEPIPGEPGADGKDADPVDVGVVVAELLPKLAPHVQEAVAEAVAGIPIPEPIPGEPGADGKDGQSPALVDVVRDVIAGLGPVIKEAVALHLATNPVERGRDGRDATPEMVAAAVQMHMLNNPIKDGVDGINFEEMEATYDGERTITLSFARGEMRKEFPFKIKNLIHRGVFKHSENYEEGDMVTWDGSMWMALGGVGMGKSFNKEDWRLIVKRGQNGKDGKDGIRGPEGIKGKDGKDITMFSERGRG